MMDKKDLRILDELKRDASQTTGKISKRLNIPVTTVHNRVKKLEKEGVVKGYTVDVDYGLLGKGMSAVILMTVVNILPGGKKVKQDELAGRLKKFSEVEEVNIITGGSDIMIKVRVGSVDELNEFIVKKLRSVDGVDKTQTMMVLKRV